MSKWRRRTNSKLRVDASDPPLMVKLLLPIRNNVCNNPHEPNLWWNFNAHQPLSGLNVSNFMSPFIPGSSLVEIDHFSLRRDCCTRTSIADARDDLPPPCGFIALKKKLTSALIRHLYFSSARCCCSPASAPFKWAVCTEAFLFTYLFSNVSILTFRRDWAAFHYGESKCLCRAVKL